MSIRVAFEVGHSATVKGKTTVEGFTHDWELYVRGIDANNIQRFVDKVVFNLHESFPKPKRAFKDPPYLLKECGYAGFELDIDIYFKCQRDEQKKITFRYDLTLPSKGSTSASERRYHTFANPSSEFRRKLLDGGGVVVYPNALSNDDRSRDAIEDRTQLLSKPKLGSSSSSGGGDTKKHKSKSSQDDSTMKPSSTFANLFGTPITKLSNSKQSPEQKLSNNSGSSSSNNTKLPPSSSAGGGGSGGSASATVSASSGNSSKQVSQKSSASSSSKDKSDKSSKSKKEKNKVSSSPMKDGKESTSSKKGTATSSAAIVDDKHQRRDDVRKEKSHNKDRERSKDKPSKQRPASPKAVATSRSPKRSASPSSRNSSSNRHLADGLSSASQSILTVRHAEEKASSSSSTNKKSKKEKRDKSFEKERERGVDGKKDSKSLPTTSKQSKDEKPLSKSLEKINGTSKRDRDGGGGSGNSTPKDTIRDKSGSSSTNAKYRQVFDAKIDSPVETVQKSGTASSGLERENKKIDKHDGSDRKHKHKKKDKKEKGRSGSKDRKKDKEKVTKAGTKEIIDENSTSSSTNHKRSYGQTPPLHSAQSVSGVKAGASTASLMSTATTHSKLSDDSSSDFDMDDDYPTTTRPASPPPLKHEKSDVADPTGPEQSNTIGLPGAVTKVSPSHRAPLGDSPTKQTKKIGKESKSKSLIAAAAATKEEFQGKKRGCKHSSSSSKRKTQSPASNEPPMKVVKKEQIKSESNREGLNAESLPDGKYAKTEPYFSSRSEQQHQPQHHQQSLQPQQSIHNQHQQQIQSDSITSNSSISLPNLSTDSSFRSPSEPTPVDYLSQLRTLQQKIMALQDNSELQQVVEMIAATGCYEITSRTFDFDLCALDRTTVQRLQDFFSQSTVIK